MSYAATTISSALKAASVRKARFATAAAAAATVAVPAVQTRTRHRPAMAMKVTTPRTTDASSVSTVSSRLRSMSTRTRPTLDDRQEETLDQGKRFKIFTPEEQRWTSIPSHRTAKPVKSALRVKTSPYASTDIRATSFLTLHVQMATEINLTLCTLESINGERKCLGLSPILEKRLPVSWRLRTHSKIRIEEGNNQYRTIPSNIKRYQITDEDLSVREKEVAELAALGVYDTGEDDEEETDEFDQVDEEDVTDVYEHATNVIETEEPSTDNVEISSQASQVATPIGPFCPPAPRRERRLRRPSFMSDCDVAIPAPKLLFPALETVQEQSEEEENVE